MFLKQDKPTQQYLAWPTTPSPPFPQTGAPFLL